MDNIAQDLGTSKKTIYKWFENKDQLIEEALSAYLMQLIPTCLPASKNEIEELYHSFNLIIQELLSFNTSFFYDLKKYHFQAYQIWDNYRQQSIVGFLKANLEKGIKSTLYRPNLDPEIVARLYVGQLENIFNRELFPPERFNTNEIYQQSRLHFLLGLVSQEGYKHFNLKTNETQ